MAASRLAEGRLMTNEPESCAAEQRSGPVFVPEDDFDLVLGWGRPNPTRAGCLSVNDLVALSRRERGISDPGYAHVAGCSPCYREFRSFQQSSPARRRRGDGDDAD